MEPSPKTLIFLYFYYSLRDGAWLKYNYESLLSYIVLKWNLENKGRKWIFLGCYFKQIFYNLVRFKESYFINIFMMDSYLTNNLQKRNMHSSIWQNEESLIAKEISSDLVNLSQIDHLGKSSKFFSFKSWNIFTF